MALVVEDGTGLPNAESYVAVTEAQAYAEARKLKFESADATDLEAALRRATAWLDGSYRDQWPGYRLTGRTQALEWPRAGAYDASGSAVAADAVPREVVAATTEAAVRELAVPGSLSPDITLGRIKRRVRVEGAVDVEYEGSGTYGDQRPVIDVIDDILSALIADLGTAGGIVGQMARC